MKYWNLHTIWTAGKNLALPDTINRNTPPELITRKSAVEIPQKICPLAEDETSPQLHCKYAINVDSDTKTIILKTSHFT